MNESQAIRVMPGMVLGHQPEGQRWEDILVVVSLRHATKWTTAKLRGFTGTATPGGVWATMDYTVRFPNHTITPGGAFRVLTHRDIKPREDR